MGEKYDGVRACWNSRKEIMYPSMLKKGYDDGGRREEGGGRRLEGGGRREEGGGRRVSRGEGRGIISD